MPPFFSQLPCEKVITSVFTNFSLNTNTLEYASLPPHHTQFVVFQIVSWLSECFQKQLCKSMCCIWEIMARQGLVFSEARHPFAQQVSLLTTSDMDSSHSLLCRVSLFQEFIPPECLEGWTLLYPKVKQCARVPKISSTTAVHKITLFSEILGYVALLCYLTADSCVLLVIFFVISCVFRDLPKTLKSKSSDIHLQVHTYLQIYGE